MNISFFESSLTANTCTDTLTDCQETGVVLALALEVMGSETHNKASHRLSSSWNQ